MVILISGSLLSHLCVHYFIKRSESECHSVEGQVSADGTIYNYKAKTLNGSRSVSLSEFMGKTVLFINVATY
uniref:Uncharacterized protein n=1 Tax=Hucho hucho TaxID=62062 RepID=A0A4W5R5F1_9TELE